MFRLSGKRQILLRRNMRRKRLRAKSQTNGVPMAVAQQFEFIVVRLHQDAGLQCTGCIMPVKKEYVRDLATGLVYHHHDCLTKHVRSSTRAIEDKSNVESVKEDIYR